MLHFVLRLFAMACVDACNGQVIVFFKDTTHCMIKVLFKGDNRVSIKLTEVRSNEANEVETPVWSDGHRRSSLLSM